MKKRLILWALALCLALLPMFAAYAAPEDAVKSVARVMVYDAAGYTIGCASAVAVGDATKPAQYFVTNNHVVSGASYIKIALGDIQSLLNVTVVEAWTSPDLVLLKLDTPSNQWTPIPIKVADSVSLGQRITSVSFPSSADRSALLLSSAADATVTKGEVSSKNVDVDGTKCICSSAKINFGSSGGALVDDSGALVGLCLGGLADEQLYYALNSDYIISALNAHRIPYTAGSNFPLWLMIVLIAAAVAALIVIIVLVTRRNARPQPVYAGAAGVATMPVEQPRPAARKANAVRITCIAGPMKGSNYSVTGTYTLGRDRTCNIVFPSDTAGVSNKHCRLTVNGSGAVLTDLQSSNGTYLVDGTKLTAGASYPLKRGDTFYLGSKSNGFMIG